MIEVGKHVIGGDAPVFVVAELGMNHNGDLALARQLVDAAAAAGADAVKFQSFHTDRFLSPDIPNRDERRAYELPMNWFDELAELAATHGMGCFSTPLDADSVDDLAQRDVPCFKIASCDVTNLPLIRHVADQGRPVILSTGFSSLGDIERALETIESAGNDRIVLLHCVAVYPTPSELANVNAIRTLQEAFGYPVGLSDHSMGTIAPVVATALGACMVEKHFTLDRELPGYDHAMSETPETMSGVVAAIRDASAALGTGRLHRCEPELARRGTARRSLYWIRDLAEGSEVTLADVAPLRPGHGLAPALLDEVVGRTLAAPVTAGSAVQHHHLDVREG